MLYNSKLTNAVGLINTHFLFPSFIGPSFFRYVPNVYIILLLSFPLLHFPSLPPASQSPKPTLIPTLSPPSPSPQPQVGLSEQPWRGRGRVARPFAATPVLRPGHALLHHALLHPPPPLPVPGRVLHQPPGQHPYHQHLPGAGAPPGGARHLRLRLRPAQLGPRGSGRRGGAGGGA